MKERILYHACEASISYGVSRISYRASDISLKNITYCYIIALKEGAVFSGAGGGGRTRTGMSPTDFESVSSANSNTPAYRGILYVKQIENASVFSILFIIKPVPQLHQQDVVL